MFGIARFKKYNSTKLSEKLLFDNIDNLLIYFKKLGVQAVAQKKDVELLVFSKLSETGRRNNKDFVSTRFLTLDIDSTTATTIEAALDKLKEYAYIAHETFNSTPENQRWRIIVPLAEDLSLEQIKQTKPAEKLASLLGIAEIDYCSNKPVQLYYMPSCPLNETRELLVNPGKLFSTNLLDMTEIQKIKVRNVSNRLEKEQELLDEMRDLKDNIFDTHLIFAHGNFHFYNGVRWASMNPDLFIKHLLINIYNEKKSLFEVKSIVNGLKHYVLEEAFPTMENGKNALVLQNVTVVPEDGTDHEHNPSFYAKYELPFEYNPKATCPTWLKFLDSIFINDEDAKQKIDLLGEFMGLCLTNKTSFQKMLFLVGNGSNGKSVILDIVRDLVGVDNSSSVPMKDFGKQFSTYNLLNKLVNIDPDMPMDHFVADDKIKPIVSGDRVSVEKKGEQALDVVLGVKLLAASNDMPKTKDHSIGFHRRILVITFNRKFSEKEQDRNLVNKLREELPGIFVWALGGLKRLLQNDGFTIPRSSIDLLDEYQKANNSVARFAEEHIQLSNNKTKQIRTSTVDLYLVYKRFCATYGYFPLNESGFGRRLKTLGITRIKSNGKSYYPVEVVNIDELKTMVDTAFRVDSFTSSTDIDAAFD
jgi:P4 family phage/plasmid primase-like protien